MSKYSILLAAFLCLPAYAGDFVKEFVQIRRGTKLYTEYRRAKPGEPTVIFPNGLTWSTHEWSPLVRALNEIDKNIGIVLYDMKGMGRTGSARHDQRAEIEIEEQVRDLADLIHALNIKGEVSVAGLSYGGAVGLLGLAQYGDMFKNVIAMAPFLARLGDQDAIINSWIHLHRQLFPFDPRTDDQLYDHYLRILVYTTYPVAEPVLLENQDLLETVYSVIPGSRAFVASSGWAIQNWVTLHRWLFPYDPRDTEALTEHYKKVLVLTVYPAALPLAASVLYKLEAVYRMVQGAKDFEAKKLARKFPQGKLHIMGGVDDAFVKDPNLREFWESLPPGVGMSYLRLRHTEHKIPQQRPEVAAGWIMEILKGNPDLQRGLLFEGDPIKGEARSGKIVLPLRKVNPCESLLRRVLGPR